MKKMRFLLVLAVSVLFVVSCHKIEGDDIPEMDKSLSCSIDTAGVLTVTTTSSSGMLIDLMKLYYVDASLQSIDRVDIDSVFLADVFVKKDHPLIDTLWEMEPNMQYKYCVIFKDFTQLSEFDTISDTTQVWLPMHTMNPTSPESVKADTAWMKNDTLCLFGTVKSHWRPLMDSIGLTRDLKFVWGTTEEMLTDTLIAEVVKDTLISSSLRINIKGIIPSADLQGAGTVWYKAYAKNAWGNGAKSSEPKSVSLNSSGKAE